MESSPGSDNPPESGDDETLDKMACIEAMLNRMEHTTNASDVLLDRMLTLVNQEDLQKMVQLQSHMLSRFEKTNEMLLNFNALSMARYDSTCQEFKRHTQLLVQMKTDVDSVFRRIRSVKTSLNKLYPEAFEVCAVKHELTEEEEEDVNSTSDSTKTDKLSSQTEGHSSQTRHNKSEHNVVSEQSNVVRSRSNTAEIIEGEDE